MKRKRQVLVMYHPDSPPRFGLYSAHVGDSSGQAITACGITEGEAIENLRLRLAADEAAEYPKKVKVNW